MGKLVIKNRFATVPNDLVNSKQISLKAKGLFAYIQSKPDGWDFSAERIAQQLKEGLPSIMSTLKELEQFRYLKRERYMAENGHRLVQYILFDEPASDNPNEGNLHIDFPSEENAYIVKPSEYIKKENTKKESNNKPIKEKTEFQDFFGNQKPKTRRDEIFDLWFKYKAEKKQKYTESGKIALLKKWDHVTDDQLEEFINHSMANNYSGIFEKSVNSNNNGNSTGEKLGTSAARMEALRNW
jgi:hypothetical protein